MSRFRKQMPFAALPENVISLPKRRPSASRSYIFSLNRENSSPVSTLAGHPVCEIESMEELRRLLALAEPAVILLSSEIKWACPIQLVEELRPITQAPIVLLVETSDRKRGKSIAKRGYQAGIHDVLYLPMDRAEIGQAIQVLLRVKSADNLVESF